MATIEERRFDRYEKREQALMKLLEFAVLYGGFLSAVLSNEKGEVVSFAGTGYDPVELARAGCSLCGPASSCRARSAVLSDRDGNCILCRFFDCPENIKSIIVVTRDESTSQHEILKYTEQGVLRILNSTREKQHTTSSPSALSGHASGRSSVSPGSRAL